MKENKYYASVVWVAGIRIYSNRVADVKQQSFAAKPGVVSAE